MRSDREESLWERFRDALLDWYERLREKDRDLRETGLPTKPGCVWFFFIIFALILIFAFMVLRGFIPDDTAAEDAELSGGVETADSIAVSPPETGSIGNGQALTDAEDEAPPKTAAIIDVSGTWVVTVDVTVANGLCAGEEDEDPYTENIIITQDSEHLVVDGLQGTHEVWDGAILGNAVGFGGTRDESEGVTTAAFALVLNDEATEMTGTELWTWKGSRGECNDGESEVSAVRQ